MSELVTNKITPGTGSSDTVTLGDSGDTFSIPSGATIANSGTATGFLPAAGTSGNVLTSNGSSWASAAGGGAWNLLQTITASNSATIEFTSNIDSTYKTYAIQGSGVTVTSTGNIYVTTGTGSTPTYSTANHYHVDYSNMSSTNYGGFGYGNNADPVLLSDVGVGSGQCAGFNLYIHDPANSTLQTVMSSQGVAMKNGNTNIGRGDMVTVYPQTTAVTAIKFWPAGGTIGVGTFKLYGIS